MSSIFFLRFGIPETRPLRDSLMARFGNWETRDEQAARRSLRAPLDQIIDLGHPLVRPRGRSTGDFFGRRFGSVCRSGPGQPPLPTRLVAGLLIL
jgi:hypothetical protein